MAETKVYSIALVDKQGRIQLVENLALPNPRYSKFRKAVMKEPWWHYAYQDTGSNAEPNWETVEYHYVPWWDKPEQGDILIYQEV